MGYFEAYRALFGSDMRHLYTDSNAEDTVRSASRLLTDNGVELSGTLLDIGGGSGLIVKLFEERYDVKGVCLDMNPSASHKVSYVKGDGRNLPVKSGSVDVVIACSMLEYIPNIFPEVDRVLKPGGVFLPLELLREAWLPAFREAGYEEFGLGYMRKRFL
ncbi:class I SAM-dependent methyltransferase [Candidatus Woesearchaeota archaeon]|nr:class I SAM-dependent methyltransferase [Candidatus Woesearchaeota archaeon]MBW3021564.1 class I SAM-dependent methyltransferase [Candidatus Woesearchaeota archaeon]